MTRQRLEEILAGFQRASVAVIGDFFLDKYLEIEPSLAEVSLETGLEARQVVAIRCQPGGAGNVVANLLSIGVGRVVCLGAIGDDGEGYELSRALARLGADTAGLVVRPDRFTPTYCKPVLRLPGGGQRELERLDHKNRRLLPAEVEEELLSRVRSLAPSLRAIIAQDQVPEPECGVITTRVREELAAVLRAHRDVVGLADSRARAGEFRDMILKPNRQEACGAIHPDSPGHRGRDSLLCASALSGRVGAPVFLTMGDEGMAVVTQGSAQRVPTASLCGELDIVGAGDSATAGIAAALCAEASLEEAAVVGNIVASITVEQVGTTGAATQHQVRRRFAEHEPTWRELPPPEALP